MAARDQIVRITYQQLEEIVGSAEPDRGNAVPKHENTYTQSPRSQKHLRQRRPAQQIYRPGQLRQGRGDDHAKAADGERGFEREENWDVEQDPKVNSTDEDGSRGSKESSGEVFGQDVQKRLDDLHIGSSSRIDKSSDEKRFNSGDKFADNKRRGNGRRPEMQRYIPKKRDLDRERRSEENDSVYVTAERGSENTNDVVAPDTMDPGGGSLPRRVRLKAQEGSMRVTVLNESIGSPLSTSPSSKSPLLQRKDFVNRHNREFNSSDKNWVGGEWWGRSGGSLQRKAKNQRDAAGSGGDSAAWRDGGRRLSNREERNAALKSYSRNRRSNSSDSRYKKNQEENADRKEQSNFSSETFPRTKSGGAKSQQANSSKDLNGAGSKNTARDGDKLYMGVTRQRTGSISSEASCASYSNGSAYSGSSDWCTEEDEPEHVLNWAEEVEKAHLEEVARLVHHGAQELTSSLNLYPATAVDSPTQEKLSMTKDPLQGPQQEKVPISLEKVLKNRNKRRNRPRKSSSQYGSRDSSVHSSIHGDEDCYSERGSERGGTRRRRRRRHNSGRSQSGRLEGRYGEGGSEELHVGEECRSGLQVTVGQNNRHVEVHRDKRHRGQSQQPHSESGGQSTLEHEAARGDGRQRYDNSNADSRKDKQNPRWDKELPPRFRRESGGSGDSQAKRGRGRGSRGVNHNHPEPELDRGFSSQDPRGISDKRLIDPAHDASSNSRVSQRGRGRRNHNSHGGSRADGQNGAKVGADSRRIGRDIDDGHSRKQQGLIHLPVKTDKLQSHQQSISRSHPHPASVVPPTTSGHYHPSHPSDSQAAPLTANTRGLIQGQKQLFDPSNPSTPILMPDAKPQIPPQYVDAERSSPSCAIGSPSSPPVDSSMTMSYPPSFYPPHPMYGFRPPVTPFHAGPYPMGPFLQGPVPSHMYYRFPRMSAPDMANYYMGEGEGEGSRAQSHMMAEQILRDSSPFDCQLGNILSRRPLSDDSQRMMNQIRFELQNRLEQVVVLDIEVANRHNVEQTLWKSVYYQIIEAYRKRMMEDPQDSSSKEKLTEVLNEGNRFFENLLQRLQTTHGFDLDAFTAEGSRPESESVNRYVKLALLSSQRIMMFLGDIARYKEQLSDSINYGKARQWYLKAQKLHPRNGRPYNQLAILAVYTKRKLDAVYYYMRSLAASNPILTAKESLLSLFDEVRRKVEVVEKKRLDERRQRLARLKKRKTLGTRLEIWVSHDGTQTHDTVDEKEDDDLSSLSPVELNKRFTLTFLNVHGKLFTKINFESFAESSSLMLQEFATLLEHSPTAISSTRFLQLMGINMFTIDHTALKDESLEVSCRSVLQEHAVQVGLEMFGLLARRAADLLLRQLEGKKKNGGRGGGMKTGALDEDVHEMLPALKAWVDWMMCHANLWNPQPFNRPPELGPDIDVWLSLARLCDLLNDMDTGHVGLAREKLPGTEPVVLQEDSMLSGFIPMLSAPQELFYANASTNKRQSEDWLRVEKLRLFGEYLCGVEPAMLAFNVDTGKYHSVAVQPEDETKKENRQNLAEDSGDESDDVVVEPVSDSEHNEGADEQKDRIQKLKLKKALLSKQREEREKNKENMEAILASHRHAKIELEIHPIFLIPDTNCFIDHFTALKAILNCCKYTLVVPLVVINELDGLARGARDDQHQSPEHAQMVQSQAKAAISFLEAEFEGKHPNLRAQTSKGSVLETIAFRSEEANNTGINDDIILSCCLHYCKDKAREFMPKSKAGPVRLHREVILLTEDRNLRLKAHTCNVPVRDVPGFKRWSKIP